jgi:hypothetical protein
MARRKTMAAIEAEITKAKEVVLTTKARHESAIADLEAAMAVFTICLLPEKHFPKTAWIFLCCIRA